MGIIDRLTKLEERMPQGCPICADWCGTVLVDDAGAVSRAECCPSCSRRVAFEEVVYLGSIALESV